MSKKCDSDEIIKYEFSEPYVEIRDGTPIDSGLSQLFGYIPSPLLRQQNDLQYNFKT